MPFTALVAYNDISAIGAMKAFGEADWKIPQDVSIVGFDDISIASFSIPPLTTIRQPLEEMGRIAAKMVLGLDRRKGRVRAGDSCAAPINRERVDGGAKEDMR